METKVYITKKKYVEAMENILKDFDSISVFRYRLYAGDFGQVLGQYYTKQQTIRLNLERIYQKAIEQWISKSDLFIPTCISIEDYFTRYMGIVLCHETLHHLFTEENINQAEQEHKAILPITEYLFPELM